MTPDTSPVLDRAYEKAAAHERLDVAEGVALIEHGDLHLLMATGGQERTEAEYSELLSATGFRLESVRPLPALPSIVVAEAV